VISLHDVSTLEDNYIEVNLLSSLLMISEYSLQLVTQLYLTLVILLLIYNKQTSHA